MGPGPTNNDVKILSSIVKVNKDPPKTKRPTTIQETFNIAGTCSENDWNKLMHKKGICNSGKIFSSENSAKNIVNLKLEPFTVERITFETNPTRFMDSVIIDAAERLGVCASTECRICPVVMYPCPYSKSFKLDGEDLSDNGYLQIFAAHVNELVEKFPEGDRSGRTYACYENNNINKPIIEELNHLLGTLESQTLNSLTPKNVFNTVQNTRLGRQDIESLTIVNTNRCIEAQNVVMSAFEKSSDYMMKYINYEIKRYTNAILVHARELKE